MLIINVMAKNEKKEEQRKQMSESPIDTRDLSGQIGSRVIDIFVCSYPGNIRTYCRDQKRKRKHVLEKS